MSTQPVLFVSHGAPTFALEPGEAGAALGALGRTLDRPQAIAVVSAHWITREVRVAVSPQPETLHDFGGFAPGLYELAYPAPGAPAWAARTLDMLAGRGWNVKADSAWGLDHGAWVPLMHMFPDADVPVFQVSMPATLGAAGAWSLGEALSVLSREGVLILGSGSLTHNLREVRFDDPDGPAEAYVERFSDAVEAALRGRDRDALLAAFEAGSPLAVDARRAHPSPDHWWPLLVAAGASDAGSAVRRVRGGVRYRVLSMDGFIFEPGP